MVFHRNLNDRNSPQVSGTLLSILADPNNAVVWMVLLLLSLLLLLFTPLEFFTSVLADGFSLESLKSPGLVSGFWPFIAMLSFLIVSTRPPTSKSFRPFNNPLAIVPNAPITIGTIVTFMFHSFFNSLARSRYLSFFSLSFRFILWSAGTAESTILQILFFLLIIIIIIIIII